MQISLNPTGLKKDWDGNVLAIGLLQDSLNQQLQNLEESLNYKIIDYLKNQSFSAKEDQIFSCQILTGKPDKLILIGLGESENLQLADLRKASAIAARESIGFEGSLGIMMPWDHFGLEVTAQAVGEACRLALFKDLRFRTKPDKRLIPSKLELLGTPNSLLQISERVEPICAGVELARELVGAPPNSLTPQVLANTAIQLSQEHGLEVKILEKKDCEEKGMGAYLAVSQGSDLSPKFIHLTYRPKGKSKKKLALVGKGLTFDSGGYNLKVGAAQIELMKFDMGGSAAVIGAARAIAELHPNDVEVHFVIAACENMVNGSAVHPGDIVKASNGKTIEINNTDAEGRLTLADALTYASELKPDAIIDLATLTGACVIALGDEIAGLWTENDDLAKNLETAAKASGEGIWRMPMHAAYKEGLKSLLADIKNTGPRAGGSITAALFLQEFVDSSIPWAHIDIAGPVWTEKEKGIDPAGATGFGVRTLVNWIYNESL